MDADWIVETYRLPSGKKPYDSFLDTLTGIAAVRAAALPRVLRKAHNLRPPDSKALGRGLFELRDHCGVRIFYTFRPGRRVMVLGGYLKKRQDFPERVLRTMRIYQADVEANDGPTKTQG
jgi:putative component of toxin-antitoxin plasmid stabilization module